MNDRYRDGLYLENRKPRRHRATFWRCYTLTVLIVVVACWLYARGVG